MVAALLVGLAGSGDAPANVNRSAPASLTVSKVFRPAAPHLSDDGSRLVYAGTHPPDASVPPNNVFLLQLGACGGETSVALNTADSIGPFGAGQDAHPSISADGSRVAWATVDEGGSLAWAFSTWFADLPDGAPVLVRSGIPIFPYLSDGSHGPLTHLSGDGRWLFHVEQVVVSGFPSTTRLIRTDLDSSGLDACDVTSSVGLVLAGHHRSVSQDGSLVVVSSFNGLQLLEQISGCTYGSSLITPDGGAHGATMSADGSVVAWASRKDACDPALGDLESNDLWIWLRNGAELSGSADSCVLEAPHPLAGSALNRFPGLDKADRGQETQPSVSADGKRILFKSDVSLDGDLNPPSGVSELWIALLFPAAASLERVTSHLQDPFHDDPEGARATVDEASLTGDGEAVAYTVRNSSDSRVDLRLVNLEVGDGASLASHLATNNRPADLPFELEFSSCQADGSEVDFVLNLRQFRGGDRQLVILLEVDDGAGTVHRRAPVVQPLVDERRATLELSVESDLTEGTCRATAHDGAVTSIDRVIDSLALSP